MARSDPQLNFRIPAELRDKLEAAAQANKRSLTGELIARLEATFDETVVTTVEARVKPGAEEKRFDFNADEIAEKVMERLESRERIKNRKMAAADDAGDAKKDGSSINKLIIVGNLGRDPEMRFGGYSQYLDVVVRGKPVRLPIRENEPYGPKKSPNSKKPKP